MKPVFEQFADNYSVIKDVGAMSRSDMRVHNMRYRLLASFKMKEVSADGEQIKDKRLPIGRYYRAYVRATIPVPEDTILTAPFSVRALKPTPTPFGYAYIPSQGCYGMMIYKGDTLDWGFYSVHVNSAAVAFGYLYPNQTLLIGCKSGEDWKEMKKRLTYLEVLHK